MTMTRSETTILVCCHKPAEIPDNEILLPIHCGKDLSDAELGMTGDNTGDNISVKNPNYCELTALYWAWKNLTGVRYIGLYHYRRYFLFSFWKEQKRLFHRNVSINVPDWSHNNLSETAVKKILDRYDIILAKPQRFPISLARQYISCHRAMDLEVTRDAIYNLSPEYLCSYDHIMTETGKLSECNMFITKWDIFNDYCKWLFSIMSYIEQHLAISEDPYQKRVFGFIAERLLNVYCYHHNLKVKYKYICFINH